MILSTWISAKSIFFGYRMFTDYLDSLHMNASTTTECMLGSSLSEVNESFSIGFSFNILRVFDMPKF